LKDAIPDFSPKLNALLSNIDKLDREDIRQYGHPFKHFLFSDIKTGPYGAKLLASALLANGYHLGYTAKPNQEKSKKLYQKIEMLTPAQLHQTSGDNFFLMASTSVYDQPITVAAKKHMLQAFNQRPENIHGDQVRFIVMDSGFKEGIDLFDVKYVHIFEPSTVASDQKQVIGRSTRTCGQSGLSFHPTRGWPLSVFVYDLSFPPAIQPIFLGTGTAMDLYLTSKRMDLRQLHFASHLENLTIFGAVDYELNLPLHQSRLTQKDNHQTGGALHIRHDIAPLIVQSEPASGFIEMRKWIYDHYRVFSWENIKMENLCQEPSTKEPSTKKEPNRRLLSYTPSQEFLRHYFTPMSPLKGMLLWWSVGTGKTCAAIATASGHFERQGYTILWVTRTTLKNDIWKNMFDQVCHEDIRHRLDTDAQFVVPTIQKNKMRLLSTSWRIRPLSYKQFSNLISKQNAYYHKLVKINGAEDPLRKTLIIIDEAHKLYGGDDLSSLERPDMLAFEQSIQQSYAVSGADSVRLLLMTATPLTQQPMELIQLLNLCKPIMQQMPSKYDGFSMTYLDDNGAFTDTGKLTYLDAISGHVSYLNRERDARQFAQPTVYPIHVPILDNIDTVKKFDRKWVKEYMTSNTGSLKKQIEEKQEQIENQFNVQLFKDLKEKQNLNVCEDIENSSDKQKCEKIVNKQIRLLVQELKSESQNIKQEIQQMRKTIQEEKKMHQEELAKIGENREQFAKEYAEYQETPFYQIKQDCVVRIDTMSDFAKNVHLHPRIAKIDQQVLDQQTRLAEWKQGMKQRLRTYHARMKYLRQLLKQDLRDIETQVVKSTIRDERQARTKEEKTTEKMFEDTIQHLENTRKNKIKHLRKTIKKRIHETKQTEREQAKEEKTLRQTLRNQQDYLQEEKVKTAIEKYTAIAKEQWKQIELERHAKDLRKTMKKREQDDKKKEQEAKKEAKKEDKKREQEDKKREQEAKKEDKKREQEAKKEDKKREQEIRKTRKNLRPI
jgi:hypothetical protein